MLACACKRPVNQPCTIRRSPRRVSGRQVASTCFTSLFCRIDARTTWGVQAAKLANGNNPASKPVDHGNYSVVFWGVGLAEKLPRDRALDGFAR